MWLHLTCAQKLHNVNGRLACMHTYRFLGFTSQPSRHLTNIISFPGDISVSSAQKVNLWTQHDINKQGMSTCMFSTDKCKGNTHFFCVSPAFTLILRTSRIFWFAALDHEKIEDPKCFIADVQESEGPSQRSEILSNSPMSSSVKTRNVFVWFRPILSVLWIKTNYFNLILINFQKNPKSC